MTSGGNILSGCRHASSGHLLTQEIEPGSALYKIFETELAVKLLPWRFILSPVMSSFLHHMDWQLSQSSSTTRIFRRVLSGRYVFLLRDGSCIERGSAVKESSLPLVPPRASTFSAKLAPNSTDNHAILG